MPATTELTEEEIGLVPGRTDYIKRSVTSKTKVNSSGEDTINFILSNGYAPFRAYNVNRSSNDRVETAPKGGYQYDWGIREYVWKNAGWDDFVSGGWSTSFRNESAALNKASSTLASKVKNQKIQTLTAIAEATKSIDMVLSQAGRVFGALGALYKLDISGAGNVLGVSLTKVQKQHRRKAKKLKAASKKAGVPLKGRDFRTVKNIPSHLAQRMGDLTSEAWLSFRYGYKPLLMDIDGAMQFLAEAPQPDVKICSGFAKSKYDDLDDKPWIIKTKKTEGFCKYTVAYRVDSDYPTFNASLGLDIRDVLQVGWELTPGSFLLDWFIPIGEYLGNFSAYAAADFLGGCLSRKWDNTDTIRVPNDASVYGETNYAAITHLVDMKTISKHSEFDRVSISSFPALAFPSFTVMGSYKRFRVADLVALSYSAVVGRKFKYLRI